MRFQIEKENMEGSTELAEGSCKERKEYTRRKNKEDMAELIFCNDTRRRKRNIYKRLFFSKVFVYVLSSILSILW